jgi:hypothetical protein
MVQITHFDGTQLSSIGIAAFIPANNEPGTTVSVGLTQRADMFPVATSYSYNEKNLVIQLTPTSGTSLTTFYTNVNRYFNPSGGLFSADKKRLLQGLHDNGSTVINANVYINSVQRDSINLYSVNITNPDGIWSSTTLVTDTTSTLANGGNTNVYPNIELTFAGSQRYRIITWSVQASRLGIVDYPITFTTDTTGAGATADINYIFFVNGVSIPITISAANSATSKFWARVSCNAGETVTGYLFYGTNIVNSKCTAFAASGIPYNAGGMDLTNSTNTLWIWTGGDITTYPFAPGVWKPGKTGVSQEGTSYGLTFSAGAWTGFAIENDNSLANDADSMVLVVGHNGVGTSNDFEGFILDMDMQDSDGILRSFVKYRVKDNPAWFILEQNTIDSTTVSSFPASNSVDHDAFPMDPEKAVEIAIGVEAAEGQPRGTLNILNMGLQVRISSPTINVGSATAASVTSSSTVLTVGSQTMAIKKAYIAGTVINVDCKNKRVTYPANVFSLVSLAFTGAGEDWISLPPGNTAFSWAGTTPSTTTFTYYDGYLL